MFIILHVNFFPYQDREGLLLNIVKEDNTN